jgi:hypothetical protein
MIHLIGVMVKVEPRSGEIDRIAWLLRLGRSDSIVLIIVISVLAGLGARPFYHRRVPSSGVNCCSCAVRGMV